MKSTYIRLRCAPEEKQGFEKAAKQANLSLSAWIIGRCGDVATKQTAVATKTVNVATKSIPVATKKEKPFVCLLKDK